MVRLPESTAILAILLIIFAIGCDRGETNDSPPVTISAPAASTEIQDNTSGDPALEPTQVKDSHSNHPAQLPEGTAQQQTTLAEGSRAFMMDEYEKAEAIFKELAFEEPITGDTVSAAVALGQIYIETGRPQEAMAMFDELYEHVKEIPEVLFIIARVFSETDEHLRALRAYDRAYELNEDYIFILPKMAEILIREEEEDRAKKLLYRYEQRVYQFAEVLEAGENTAEEQRLYALDILAMLHDERAHQALTAALEDPSNQIRRGAAFALGELGVVEAENNLRTVATEDQDEAVRNAAREALTIVQNL